MSPSAVPAPTAKGHFENDLNLSLLGLGVEYPPFLVGPEALETLANRFYPPSPAYVLTHRRLRDNITLTDVSAITNACFLPPSDSRRSSPSIV